MTSFSPPETVESVKGELGKSDFTQRKLIFTEFGLSPVVSASPLHTSPQERLLLQTKLHVLPRSPLSFKKSESPGISLPQARTKIINGTPKSHRQCHCKQSKCLKLYCECFASGSYCDECSCANCHNNVENEDVRREAAECILERNPNAFKPKITGSPCTPPDDGDAAKDVLAKHIKGCHCKRTGCLKKYCECFQANILCSENCKCVSCKNMEGSELGMVVTSENHCKTKAYIQQENANSSSAVVSSSHIFPQESRKRTFRELFDSNMRDTEIREFTKHHAVDPVGVHVSIPTLRADCVCQIASSAALGSLKLTYRSLLADAIHPLDTTELCSLLVVVSDAAKFLADEHCKAQIKEVKEYQMACDLEKDCKKEPDVHQVVPHNQLPGSQTDITVMDNSRSCDIGMQDGGPFSSEGDYLMCDEKDKLFTRSASLDQNLNHGCNENFTEEHERLVLTCLRDCLGKLIAFGTMKGMGLPFIFLNRYKNYEFESLSTIQH
ncbi:protein tesmin/TSO1-like CXC 6 isoform X1 [Populus alba x Populus x berolinensis]|uniref:Protein tesmin/TSO1-like CXC 6 isoform X1 n=1 Tax=Populus alba x Populus x berolinensis TaxID=444605 RepID=A0AAD6WGC0_9ROSI|nr:protein tesmin/TSO1-like CXC 6 isoform X1 [Populus alba x Populus x berolinensis]